MAAFITILSVVAAAGIVLGAYYIKICFAIRREDRSRGSLRFDAPNQSAQSARTMVGVTSSRWN
jgi:hypothetical protein